MDVPYVDLLVLAIGTGAQCRTLAMVRTFLRDNMALRQHAERSKWTWPCKICQVGWGQIRGTNSLAPNLLLLVNWTTEHLPSGELT